MEWNKEGAYPDMDLKSIFARIANGDKDAFEIFYSEYRERVFNSFYREAKDAVVARELAQSFFLNIWTKGPKLLTVDTPGAYMKRMILYMCYNHYDTVLVKRLRAAPLPEDNLLPGVDEILRKYDRQQLWDCIEQTLRGLPPGQVKVFKMRFKEGLTDKEIAACTGLGLRSVVVYCSQVLEAVRRNFQKNCAFN